MFDWLTDRDQESRHDRAIERDIAQAERNPRQSIPFADHTDQRPDPPSINGRVADEIRVDEPSGKTTVVEVETDPGSSRSEEQIADLREGAEDIGWGFETETVDDEWRF